MPSYPTSSASSTTAAYTSEDLEQIDAQMRLMSQGKSISEYEIAGRKLKYRDLSLNDLQRLRRTVENALNAANGKRRLRYSLISTSKGFD